MHITQGFHLKGFICPQCSPCLSLTLRVLTWLKQTFTEADKNGDGSLSIGEVLQLLHKLNVNLPRQKVKQMFKVCEKGQGHFQSGPVSFVTSSCSPGREVTLKINLLIHCNWFQCACTANVYLQLMKLEVSWDILLLPYNVEQVIMSCDTDGPCCCNQQLRKYRSYGLID